MECAWSDDLIGCDARGSICHEQVVCRNKVRFEVGVESSEF